MNRAIKRTNALILAAGISKRMQSLKAFLAFDEKNSFFEKIVNTYSEWGCNEIIVVINRLFSDSMPHDTKLPSQLKFVLNEQLEFERFYSVKIGLQKMTDIDFCFLQNIDNPFITSDILDKIYNYKSQQAFVIPIYNNKGGHPVLINRSNINYIKSYPENDANLRKVLGEMPSVKAEMEDESILININNTVEYDKYFTLIQN